MLDNHCENPPITPSLRSVHIILFFIVLVWGLNWPINKIGLHYISPLHFAAIRLFLATITMFALVIRLKKLIIPRRIDLPIIFIIGIVHMCCFMILINLGLRYVDAGRSAILVYTTPLWVMPLAILFFQEKASLLRWFGLFLGLIGIVILFSPWGIDWHNRLELVGNGVLLLAAFCWAISMLCSRHMTWHRSPLELLPWQLLVGTIPVALLAWHQKSIEPTQWNGPLIFSLVYTSIFATAFGYWGMLTVSKELPSVTASLSFLAVPVSGLIFSAILLHEPITLAKGSAMACILFGLGCIAFRESNKKWLKGK